MAPPRSAARWKGDWPANALASMKKIAVVA
jgi:hypothetical protein